MLDARSEHVSFQQALQLRWLQQRGSACNRLCSSAGFKEAPTRRRTLRKPDTEGARKSKPSSALWSSLLNWLCKLANICDVPAVHVSTPIPIVISTFANPVVFFIIPEFFTTDVFLRMRKYDCGHDPRNLRPLSHHIVTSNRPATAKRFVIYRARKLYVRVGTKSKLCHVASSAFKLFVCGKLKACYGPGLGLRKYQETISHQTHD